MAIKSKKSQPDVPSKDSPHIEPRHHGNFPKNDTIGRGLPIGHGFDRDSGYDDPMGVDWDGI